VDEEENDNELESVINSTEPVVYSYASYLIAKTAGWFCCCCCKNIPWVKKTLRQRNLYEKAFNEISNEIDIRRFISASRASHLMTKMFIKPNQSHLVKYFKRYTVDSDDEEMPDQPIENTSTQDILRDFKP